jgi:hypothetical protein
MEKHQMIKDILFLPSKFYADGNISMYFLLKETGYFELYNQVDEGNIFEMLIQHSDCVNQWLTWSEDKRSSSGWYFKQNGDSKYVVGYFPVKEDLAIIEYFDIIEACAAFIKHEIEDIRRS